MSLAAAFDGEALGSPLRLVLHGVERPRVAWRAVLAEMAAVDDELSSLRADSALNRLNAAPGSAMAAPRRLRAALALAWRAFRSTNGLFDPRQSSRSPGASRHTTWLQSSRQAVAVAEPVDLDGIGKGLALRWCRDRLRAAGVTDYLLVAGGDLVAAGTAPSGHPWRVSVSGADPRGVPVAVLELPAESLALATSAITRHRRHIVDPRSGRPVTGPLLQVSVAGADPAWAEIVTKLALIGGRADAGARAWWLTDAGAFDATAGARRWIAWSRMPLARPEAVEIGT